MNGILEEIFWRGVFQRRFPSSIVLGVIYPALLLYNWVAWRTGSIRWTALAHVVTNLSGIGALFVFAPAGQAS